MTPISTTSSVEISIKDIHILNTPCEGTHPYFSETSLQTFVPKAKKNLMKNLLLVFFYSDLKIVFPASMMGLALRVENCVI